ncbi:MAG: hypothetical protein LIO46_00010 [Clostridiales bacterium]|nr:hypothetical protein [Clostridiales bacterium]
MQDLSGAGVCALIIGEVVHAAMAEDCAPLEGKCGPDRFAYFVHAAADLRTGAGYRSAIAALRLEQVPEETQNV